ncbi:hypothetical protein [Streptomyces sp. NBC_01304]|uniref:hypothetical protein n=1 Tax=Streptomyces sp. NBC_01304 TaxID=2903818 RepID=UPI002E0FEACE|nr:hypothetical protein OG430_06805 [Streptomyces sp. NBC_01304]
MRPVGLKIASVDVSVAWMMKAMTKSTAAAKASIYLLLPGGDAPQPVARSASLSAVFPYVSQSFGRPEVSFSCRGGSSGRASRHCGNPAGTVILHIADITALILILWIAFFLLNANTANSAVDWIHDAAN